MSTELRYCILGGPLSAGRASAALLEATRSFRSAGEISRLALAEERAGYQKSYNALSRLADRAPSPLRPYADRILQLAAHGVARKLQVRESEVLAQVSEFHRSGHLITDQELLQRVGAHAVTRPSEGLRSVSVVTRNRPHLLERCLLSYIENISRSGRDVEFVVMDDSGQDSESANRAVLSGFRRRFGVKIAHAGIVRREAYAVELAKASGLPVDICRFALLGPPGADCTTGANRNSVLLHTAGSMTFSADDDTICEPHLAFGAHDGLKFHSHGDPRTFQFFRNSGQALRSCIKTTQDLLRSHEDFLGCNTAACLESSGSGDVTLANSDAGLAAALLSGKEFVAATFPGLVGDSGMGSPTRLLWLGGASFRNLVRTDATYRAGITTRQVTRCTAAPVLSNSDFFMSTFLGLDNRDLLPPFIPAYRNQDGLYGATIRQCLPTALMAYVPGILPHLPEQERSFREDEVAACGASRVNHTLKMLLGAAPAPAIDMDRAAAMKSLAAWAADLGNAPLDEFIETVTQVRTAELQRRVTTLSGVLQKTQGEPECWAQDVRRHLASAKSALRFPDRAIPFEFQQAPSRRAALADLQRLVSAFGRLLDVWPEMVEAAKFLKTRDVTLAQPVSATI